MKNVSEVLNLDTAYVVDLPSLSSKFIFAMHEGGLFYNKFSEMSALSGPVVNVKDEDDTMMLAVYHLPQEGFDRQKGVKALTDKFDDYVNQLIDAFMVYANNKEIFGDKPKYSYAGIPDIDFQRQPTTQRTISNGTVIELLNRVFGLSLNDREWCAGEGIIQGGVMCPKHEKTGAGNVVTLTHYTGVAVGMAPDACGFDEGESTQFHDSYKENGGFWFSAFVGDVKYRGLITHPRYKLEEQTPGDFEDIRDTVCNLIGMYYPIIFASKSVRDMFRESFQLGAPQEHNHVH